MNILLVDDDRYVLEGIKEGIDWSALPIEGIYTAQNAQQAKRILLSTPVQILVSDIEMPRESGLDLLEWVNGQGMKLQNIFLTSYAQFGYAQRAVSLGSFEYFLKPIEYDKLQQIIGKAAEKVRQEERGGVLRLRRILGGQPGQHPGLLLARAVRAARAGEPGGDPAPRTGI